jgi:hypothetical protein
MDGELWALIVNADIEVFLHASGNRECAEKAVDKLIMGVW